MRRLTTTMAMAMAAAAVVAGAAPATADTTGHWSDIEFQFATGASTGRVLAADALGFPDTEVTSNTIGPASRASGAGTWHSETSDPGQVYGSSRDRPYLSLRPAANNPASPSTTTYTFDRATPAQGWTFVLGDVDAELLDVTALDADGEPVAAADLGFQSTFNYCRTSPRPTTACDDTKPQSEPSWDPTTGRLAGPTTPDPGWTDTDGASAWFEPTVPLSELTITSTQREGLPVYQTWFATLSRDVTGTVTGSDACSPQDLAVVLRSADGTELATTTTGPDGTYRFDDVSTYADHTVTVTPADGCRSAGGADAVADLSATDAVVDIALEPVTAVLEGTVADEAGDPVADVGIAVDGPDGFEADGTSGVDGTYELPGLPPGESTVTVDPADGYEVVGGAERIVVVDEEGSDVTLDVVLARVDETPPTGPPPLDATLDPPVAAPADVVRGGAPLPDAGGAPGWLAPVGLGLLILGGALLLATSARAHSSARAWRR